MDPVLEQLKAGVRWFRREVYPERAEVFAQAASTPQRPHTLFITCADSRIDPIEITSSGTGEVFVTRNIGNLVPTYGQMMGSMSAVLEFAVGALGVRHVVVCGHSDCGAMKALLAPESTAKMPAVSNWLKNAQEALWEAKQAHEAAVARGGIVRSLVDELTEMNVLLQIAHLKTHPSVRDAMARGELTVSGWIYDIGSGRVSIAEDGETRFRPVETRKQDDSMVRLAYREL